MDEIGRRAAYPYRFGKGDSRRKKGYRMRELLHQVSRMNTLPKGMLEKNRRRAKGAGQAKPSRDNRARGNNLNQDNREGQENTRQIPRGGNRRADKGDDNKRAHGRRRGSGNTT